MSCFGPGEAGVEAPQASSGFYALPPTSSSQQMASCCPSPAQRLCLCCRGRGGGWGWGVWHWGGGTVLPPGGLWILMHLAS